MPLLSAIYQLLLPTLTSALRLFGFGQKDDEPVVTNFRRGTNFFGQLGPLNEDPLDVFKKQFGAQFLRANAMAIKEVLQKFELSLSDLAIVKEQFKSSMEKGLRSEGNSDLKMIPTFVTKTPDGTETGEYMALDLGGTNFRVLLLTMTGIADQKILLAKEFSIKLSIMRSDGDTLFGFIAEKIEEFMMLHNIDKSKVRKLGFTFSFPCSQRSLESGDLIHWTKGFDCPDVVGKDVVEWLQKSIDQRNLKLKVVALVNDTVGTLMATAFQHPNCGMGMIVGTGTNACYIEKTANIRNSGDLRTKCDEMIVNMEWGAYGDSDSECSLDRFITEFDREIDLSSINPGKQRFEKLISGMYLGEIVRLVLVHLFEKDLFCFKYLSNRSTYGSYRSALYTRNGFLTKYVSQIEKDRGNSFKNTRPVMDAMGLDETTVDDYAVLHAVCKSVSQRSAKLLAAAMAATLEKMGKRDLTVGIDGSLYRYHPRFMQTVEFYCNVLLDRKIDYQISLASDGSGIGAALAAAAAAASEEE